MSCFNFSKASKPISPLEFNLNKAQKLILKLRNRQAQCLVLTSQKLEVLFIHAWCISQTGSESGLHFAFQSTEAGVLFPEIVKLLLYSELLFTV